MGLYIKVVSRVLVGCDLVGYRVNIHKQTKTSHEKRETIVEPDTLKVILKDNGEYYHGDMIGTVQAKRVGKRLQIDSTKYVVEGYMEVCSYIQGIRLSGLSLEYKKRYLEVREKYQLFKLPTNVNVYLNNRISPSSLGGLIDDSHRYITVNGKPINSFNAIEMPGKMLSGFEGKRKEEIADMILLVQSKFMLDIDNKAEIQKLYKLVNGV